MKEELLKLQNLIREDFCGVIWLTSEGLHQDLPYFSALDYFVNGALKQIAHHKALPSGNMVLGKNFDHTFFIAHYSSDYDLKKITDCLDIVYSEQIKTCPKVLLLGEIPLRVEEALKKKAPYLQFEILAS